MDFKNICLKILHNESVTIEELNNLIVDACEARNHIIPNAKDLQGIIGLIQNGVFNINSLIFQYCLIKQWQLYSIQNKFGQTIAIYIL